MRIHVGTSGFNYPEWRGTFYPEGMKSGDMFGFYAERFHTVEINQTFYRMPTPKTAEGWRAQARYMASLLVRSVERDVIVQPPRLLTGHDIMRELGLAPGPAVGRLLAALEEAQAVGEVEDRAGALAFVRRRAGEDTSGGSEDTP